jgi:hypothetical protein
MPAENAEPSTNSPSAWPTGSSLPRSTRADPQPLRCRDVSAVFQRFCPERLCYRIPSALKISYAKRLVVNFSHLSGSFTTRICSATRRDPSQISHLPPALYHFKESLVWTAGVLLSEEVALMIIRGLGRRHAPILRSHQRLLRALKVTVIVQMLRSTTLTIRVISRPSFLLVRTARAITRAFPSEAQVLHPETRPTRLYRKLCFMSGEFSKQISG